MRCLRPLPPWGVFPWFAVALVTLDAWSRGA